MEEYSRILAEFVSDFDPKDIPDAARERTRQSILNAIAAALSAVHAEGVNTLIDVLSLDDRAGSTHLIGRPETFGMLNAVMINAFMAHYNDYDDTHMATVFHSNASTVPALLALGTRLHSNGQDAVTSLALGLEASIRLGLGLGRSHYEIGWHITGTMGAVGTALTCARLLELDVKHTSYALGLALTQAGGLRGQMFGTDAKPLNAAKAAYNGLLAALLAERSFTAAENGIEGANMFVSAATREPDLSLITKGLGSTWEVERIGFKPYASGVMTHASIDSIFALREQLGLDDQSSAEEVSEVVRGIESLTMNIPMRYLGAPRKRDITDPLQAKFSMYNVPAIVLVRGRAGPGEYNQSVLTDPTIEYLRQLIELNGVPAFQPWTAGLTAKLRDGREINITIDKALGSADRNLDDTALRKKLFDASEGVIDQKSVERIAVEIENIEKLQDLGELIPLISG